MADLPTSVFETILAAVAPFAPSALGAAVGQAHQKGLSVRDRIIQWSAGIAVSHYVTAAVTAWLELQLEVSQGLGFVLGVLAFQATPKFIATGSDALAAIPGIIVRLKGGQ